MRKKGRLTGFLQGLFFGSKVSELSALVMLQKIIEGEEYKNEGFDNVRDFCKEVSGMTYETINARLNTIKKIGAEGTSILSSLNLTYKDAKMIEHALIEDAKTGKMALKIDEHRIIPFDEDRKDEIQIAIDLLREQRESERKEAKRLAAKLEGIDREHKKEIKAMQKEIEDLRSMLPKDEEDREWAEKFIEEIDKAFINVDLKIRQFAFHKKLYSDPVLQAKVLGLHEQVKARFADFERDFDALITEDSE